MEEKLWIYLAAPWVDRTMMESVALQFEEAGYGITHRWWFKESTPVGDRTPEFMRQCAVEDVRGVAEADVVVVFNTGKSEGKAVEQGLAIAWGVPIVSIGKLGEYSNNVFHYLDNYKWVETIPEAINCIKEHAVGFIV